MSIGQRSHLCLLALLLALVASLPGRAAEQAAVTFTEEEGGLAIAVGGTPMARYVHGDTVSPSAASPQTDEARH